MDGISFSFSAGVGGIDFDPIPKAKAAPVAQSIPIAPKPNYHPDDDYMSKLANSPESKAKEAVRLAAEIAYYQAHPEARKQSPSHDCSPSFMDEVRAAFKMVFPDKY